MRFERKIWGFLRCIAQKCDNFFEEKSTLLKIATEDGGLTVPSEKM